MLYKFDLYDYIEFNEFVTNVLPEHDHPGYEANNWQSIAHHDPKPPNIMVGAVSYTHLRAHET